jgi:hypothetical protein
LGGGVLCLAYLLVFGGRDPGGMRVFSLDPFGGWRFLNFGRHLVYPMEAFYHAVFFGAVLAVVRRRFVVAAALAALLSASHPFTGLQLLAVLGAWGALERIVFRNDTVPNWFVGGIALLRAVHVGCYLVYLPLSPEHRQLMRQRAFAWLLEWPSFVPAYFLVGALAFWRSHTRNRMRVVLADPKARLFAVWLLVSFALANHESVARPVQPLHFTRGYIWSPLFLIGAPALDCSGFDGQCGALLLPAGYSCY